MTLRWFALAAGAAAAGAALYGHYRVLPVVADRPGNLPARKRRVHDPVPKPAIAPSRRAQRRARPAALRAARRRHASAAGRALCSIVMTLPGARDERLSRLQPDDQPSPVPHLLDRPCRERGADDPADRSLDGVVVGSRPPRATDGPQRSRSPPRTPRIDILSGLRALSGLGGYVVVAIRSSCV